MAIEHEEPRNANDPNRGLNVRVFMVIVAVAGILIAVVLFFTVAGGGHKAMPEPTKTTQPSSSNVTPPTLLAKPSPLHLASKQRASSQTASLRQPRAGE